VKHNVGSVDATLRVTIAALLSLVIAIAVQELSLLASLGVAVVGLVLLATGITRVCPLYTLLGINTCPRAPAHSKRKS
jgi:hypothetical protein